MTGRFSWLLALGVLIVCGALMGLIGSDDSSQQSPVPVPAGAESARADALRAQLPGGDRVPAILVFSRTDGGALTPADLSAIKQQPVVVAEDGRAAVATVALDAKLSGFALTDKVKELRQSVKGDLPEDLRVQVTGGPAFGADIADSFSGATTRCWP
jgi:RND superfamily putative drug exporter